MKVFLKSRFLILIFVELLLIITMTFSLTLTFLSKSTPNIMKVVESKLEKVTYEMITDKINTDLINDSNLKDILLLTKNSEGEILAVDYNLEKAYKVNNLINNSIRNSIYNLESGILANSEFVLGVNSMYIDVPMFVSSENIIISSLGPKIPVKISFIGTVVTNLQTKITSYGLNNVLNEIYVTVEITELITTPVSEEKYSVKYDILIDATMINGRVPSYYGENIIENSSILDIPIE